MLVSRLLRSAPLLGAGLLGLSLVCSAFAQETWGAIRGAVTDPTGAGVPNARVELSGSSLPRTLSAITDTVGAYQFLQVPAGTGYTLSTTAQGFRTAKVAEVN